MFVKVTIRPSPEIYGGLCPDALVLPDSFGVGAGSGRLRLVNAPVGAQASSWAPTEHLCRQWGPGVEPLDLTGTPAGVHVLTLIPPQGSRQMVRLVIQQLTVDASSSRKRWEDKRAPFKNRRINIAGQ